MHNRARLSFCDRLQRANGGLINFRGSAFSDNGGNHGGDALSLEIVAVESAVIRNEYRNPQSLTPLNGLSPATRMPRSSTPLCLLSRFSANMPIFKARQEQPLDIASGSSSIPPSQLYSTEVSHTLSPTRCLSSLVEHYTPTKSSKPKADAFAWSRLPQHIRRDILAHALLPDGPDTPMIIGLPEHRAHLNTTALPIFLAMGSWEAYVNAASIFYQHVHLHLALFQESTGVFLTSPSTLRPRSLVVRMQLHFTIRKYMILFDMGYTISGSMGKLIKMNIPTALRSLRTHGRLEDVHLVILKGPQAVTEDWGESAVPGY